MMYLAIKGSCLQLFSVHNFAQPNYDPQKKFLFDSVTDQEFVCLGKHTMLVI